MERLGNLKEVWLMCPGCKERFNAEKVFWDEPEFAKLKLHCPFCGIDFEKEKSPKIWGLDRGA